MNFLIIEKLRDHLVEPFVATCRAVGQSENAHSRLNKPSKKYEKIQQNIPVCQNFNQ